MLSTIFVRIYALSFGETLLILAGLFLLWSCIQAEMRGLSRWQRRFRHLCAAGLCLWVGILLYMTVFSRESGELIVQREFFHQLRAYLAGGSEETLRTAWMNVLLFIPGGLCFSASLPQRWPLWIRACMVFCVLLLFSFAIEAIQYRYALGCVEADDLLSNGLGALLGILMQEGARIYSRRL